MFTYVTLIFLHDANFLIMMNKFHIVRNCIYFRYLSIFFISEVSQAIIPQTYDKMKYFCFTMYVAPFAKSALSFIFFCLFTYIILTSVLFQDSFSFFIYTWMINKIDIVVVKLF